MAKIAQGRGSLLERALGSLERIAERRGRRPNLPPHLATGFAGEDAAFFYLRRKGYTWWRGAGPQAMCPATLT